MPRRSALPDDLTYTARTALPRSASVTSASWSVPFSMASSPCPDVPRVTTTAPLSGRGPEGPGVGSAAPGPAAVAGSETGGGASSVTVRSPDPAAGAGFEAQPPMTRTASRPPTRVAYVFDDTPTT